MPMPDLTKPLVTSDTNIPVQVQQMTLEGFSNQYLVSHKRSDGTWGFPAMHPLGWVEANLVNVPQVRKEWMLLDMVSFDRTRLTTVRQAIPSMSPHLAQIELTYEDGILISAEVVDRNRNGSL